MNFISAFNELDRLYEALEEDGEEALEIEVADDEPTDDHIDVEVVEDPVDEPAANQLVLKCENCGALSIKAEADVEVDEDGGLANQEESCPFCDEADGYTVIGTFMPYNNAAEGTDKDDADDSVEIEIIDDEEEQGDQEEGEAPVEKATEDGLEESAANDGLNTAGSEEPIEEGIFDKKPSAAQKQGMQEFEDEVSKVSGNKDLTDISYEMVGLIKSAVSEAETHYKRNRAHLDGTSYNNQFRNMQQQTMSGIKDAMKALKKINNFVHPHSVIARVIDRIVSELDNPSSVNKMEKIGQILYKVSEIRADKKVIAMELQSFNKQILYDLQDVADDLKARDRWYAESVDTESVTEIEEGIFDSKATKQKAYNEEIKKIFRTDATALSHRISGVAERVVSDCASSMPGDMGESKSKAVSLVRLIRAATSKKAYNNSPQSLIKQIISLGQKYTVDTDDLKEFISNVNKLQNASKSGSKAMEFLMEKVNTVTATKLEKRLAFLCKEYGIRE